MENKIKERYGAYIHLASILLFILSSYYMYDFYKSLSGFIANQFREPLVMIPIFLSYFLPVFCFLFYFYDFYIGNVAKAVRIGYSAIVIILAIVNLLGLFNSLDVYASNSSLGAYDSLLGVVVKFPYDAILFNVILLAMQGLNIFMMIKPGHNIPTVKEQLKYKGTVKVGIIEYILLCVLAILVFVFVGAGISGVKNAVQNMFYDLKYAFLVVWVFLIPLLNLFILVAKPEKRLEKKRDKIIVLASAIAINVIFFALVIIFEKISPDYMVHLAKPLFTIAFSVSLPIEMLVLIGIMGISSLVFAVRMIIEIIKKQVD